MDGQWFRTFEIFKKVQKILKRNPCRNRYRYRKLYRNIRFFIFAKVGIISRNYTKFRNCYRNAWPYYVAKEVADYGVKTIKYCSKILKKCHVTLWLTPSLPHVTFDETGEDSPPLKCHVLFEWPLTKDTCVYILSKTVINNCNNVII